MRRVLESGNYSPNLTEARATAWCLANGWKITAFRAPRAGEVILMYSGGSAETVSRTYNDSLSSSWCLILEKINA